MALSFVDSPRLAQWGLATQVDSPRAAEFTYGLVDSPRGAEWTLEISVDSPRATEFVYSNAAFQAIFYPEA